MAANLLRRAIAAYESGAWPEAEAVCAELLKTDPNYPDALQILGNIRARSGDTAAAEPLFERARAVSPGNIFILNSLGGVYAANGRTAEAREALEAALRIDGNFPWALQNCGGLLMEAGERAAAKRCFERALGTDPRHVESIAALADLAEKENRLDDARALANRALALAPNFLAARSVIARLAMRAGDASAAESIARDMLAQPGLRPNLRSTTIMLLGEALEKLDRFEEAFASFTEANEMDRKLQAPRFENVRYASSPVAIAKQTEFMRTADPSTWTRPPADGLPTPVFLVGFPRSGTTLLQQVLAGHPDIMTLEEQDNFRDAHELLLLAPGALERWSSLPQDELGKWRREYWSRVERKTPAGAMRATYLDKLPMNLAVLPVIHFLFPDAKFILALRDPRDVIVSCFRNHFAINAAMYQFLSLEGAARYYNAVMTSAEVARERLPLALHVVCYEDVVADLRGEAMRLMEFLGQPWTEDVLKYTETASRREIYTPSATQVIQPIYRTSMGQWRRYEAQLAPVLPVLEPWVRKFGY